MKKLILLGVLCAIAVISAGAVALANTHKPIEAPTEATREERIIIINTEPIVITTEAITLSTPPLATEPEADSFIALDLPIDEETQRYIYTICKENGIEYAFALATMKLESEFKRTATGHNDNGTTDRGICQVNSCWVKHFKGLGWIEKADDLYDLNTNIKCGMYVLKEAVDEYGNTERAYAYYNTGSKKVKSNKASRAVWEYRNEFVDLLESEESK